MIIELPTGFKFETGNIPVDFEERIKKIFLQYASGTKEEYRYMDKLSFIDVCVNCLRGSKPSYIAVREIIHQSVDYELNENGTMPTMDDLMAEEYLQHCYENGRHSAMLYSEFYKKGSHEDEKIMKLLCRIIKTVMNVEDCGKIEEARK